MAKSTLAGQVREQYKDGSSGRVNLAAGIYLAIVKDTVDEQKQGRIRVWIPEFKSNPEDESSWLTVSYCSPFAGSTDPFKLVHKSLVTHKNLTDSGSRYLMLITKF
jgi:hypothetical protein